jgi:MEMO1 family protein
VSFDVLGIIAPHPPIMVSEVGHEEARVTAASAASMQQAGLLLERFAPDTVVIVSPHAVGYRDAFGVTCEQHVSGDLGQFGAPQVALSVPGDPDLGREIVTRTEAGGHACACRTAPGMHPSSLDHGVLVPMSFLDRGHGYPLLVLSFSWDDYEAHKAFGRAIAESAQALGRKVALVASGDCSHRLKHGAPAGYSPRAHLFDEALVEALRRGDFASLSQIDPGLIEEAGECGLRSFIILGAFLEGTGAAGKVLSYEGPWGVGYLTAVFADPEVIAGLDATEGAEETPTPASGSKGGVKGSGESPPVRLARATIEQYVREGTVPTADAAGDEELSKPAGAFVSLHTHGQLRGCIGTIAPTRPTLAEEIVHNAVEASQRDPRFDPVRAEELDDLEISVDVLHEPEPCCVDELDPKTYGVIVSCGWKRGLLLPDLEGVDTVEDQVDIARRKGGIHPGEQVSLERFKVDRHA